MELLNKIGGALLIGMLFFAVVVTFVVGGITLYMCLVHDMVVQPRKPVPAAQLYKLNDSTGVFTRVPGDKAVKQLQAGTYYIGTKNPEKP